MELGYLPRQKHKSLHRLLTNTKTDTRSLSDSNHENRRRRPARAASFGLAVVSEIVGFASCFKLRFEPAILEFRSRKAPAEIASFGPHDNDGAL
jgi:hypothetical protein